MTSQVSRGRIDGLDLLRGVAIGLVMLRHAVPSAFPGAGVVGVVMFFTLSGYLITGLLLEELERTGRVDLRRFAARRARRLLPALVVLVAVFAAVTLVLDPLGDRDRLLPTVAIMLTFTGNLPFAHGSAASFHVWTLATEEQFYLLWPATLMLAWRRGRVGSALAAVASVCLLGCVASLLWLAPAWDLAYALPTSWAVCFVVGAAVAVFARRLEAPAWLGGRTGIGVAFAGLAVLCVVPLRGHPLTYLAGGPAIALLTAVLLVGARHWTTLSSPVPVVRHVQRGLVLLGTVSYAAYLWNYPLTLWLRPSLGDVPAGLLAAVLTLVAARLSWVYVERPLARRRTPAVAEQVAAPA